MVCVFTSLLTCNILKHSDILPPTLKPDAEAVSFSHNSLGRGGAGDEGGGGSCPGTPEMRRRQEEALRRLAGQVGSPVYLMYIYSITQWITRQCLVIENN